MRLSDIFGLKTPVKICPDCGDTGPRILNRCPSCEAIYQKAEKERQERRAWINKRDQHRANGFDEGWD